MKKIILKMSGLLLVTLNCFMPLNAEPIIIEEQGNTQSLADYGILTEELKKQYMPTEQQIEAMGEKALKNYAKGPYKISAFPIKTKGLVLGNVNRKIFKKPLNMKPFFFIGSDAKSLQWLQKNHEELSSRNATGFLVEVPSRQAYDRAKAVAKQLILRPTDVTSLAKQLNIKRYPVFVTETEIRQ